MDKMTTATFVQKASTRHNDQYSYDDAVYTGSHQKVEISCPTHGPFWQLATNHLNGQGCPKCNRNKPISTAAFIERAVGVHGLKYDYTEVQYTGSYQKVKIVCLAHGPFWQSPTSHLGKNGCPICAGNNRCNTTEFIMKARLVHGNKYKYTNVDYKSNDEKVAIECPDHGIFWQIPVSPS